MRLVDIGYYTDGIGRLYSSGLAAVADDRTNLLTYLDSWSDLAPDALEQARQMDWANWFVLYPRRRQAKYAKEVASKIGNILMPDRLLRATFLARQCHVTEGLAIIGLANHGWPEPEPQKEGEGWATLA